MINKPQVILAKAILCPHCTQFMPIYEKASEDYGNKYDFSWYDFADDAPIPNKDNFENDHEGLVNIIDGYPTVIIKLNNKSHVKVDPTLIRNNDINKAVKEFINNIENGLKTLSSGRRKEYISLEGGYNIENDNLFKNKYIKYKQKYLKLKTSFI